jgi:hypothetical protein
MMSHTFTPEPFDGLQPMFFVTAGAKDDIDAGVIKLHRLTIDAAALSPAIPAKNAFQFFGCLRRDAR